MEKKRKAVPSKKKIAEYWCGKYISNKFEIIDKYEAGAVLIIKDCGEPECWACGESENALFENPKYYETLATKSFMKVWDFKEVGFLQRAHVVPSMLGGENKPSNYFLLCKRCHQESPDFIDGRYFYAYVYHSRNNAGEIRSRRTFETLRAIHELAFLMKKNILTAQKGLVNLKYNLEKMGFHNTNYSEYSEASAVVEGMDNLELEKISDVDFEKMQKEYLEYGIKFER